MEKQFCSYEISLELKKLGFDEPCFGRYEYADSAKFDEIILQITHTPSQNTFSWQIASASTWQQTIDWFANTHKIFIEIRFADKALTVYEFCVYKTFEELVQNTIERISLGDDKKVYPTYYETREQAILKAIEIIKTNKINDTTK